jgi:hypothetical protein
VGSFPVIHGSSIPSETIEFHVIPSNDESWRVKHARKRAIILLAVCNLKIWIAR